MRLGLSARCAAQQYQAADVRFGSKADIARDRLNVRFTPKSGHWNAVPRPLPHIKPMPRGGNRYTCRRCVRANIRRRRYEKPKYSLVSLNSSLFNVEPHALRERK